MRTLVLCAVLVGFGIAVHAQSVQVSKENKTIAITAEASASVDADMAIVTIGYDNYGPDEHAAYENSVKASNRISKALVASGVRDGLIHTKKVVVESIDPEKDWTLEQKQQRKYHARQSWEITVPAKQAQSLVDVAMRGGANTIENVEWQYSNLPELQAKAGGEALAKAKMIADQMANGLGSKLGPLVYASNQAPVVPFFRTYSTMASNMTVEVTASRDTESLSLFPEKVSQSATVHAVFSIE